MVALIRVAILERPHIGEARIAIAQSASELEPSRGIGRLAANRGAAGLVAALVLAVAIAGAYFTRDDAPVSALPMPAPDLELVQPTNTGNAELPSVSPDGRYVAYVQRQGADPLVCVAGLEPGGWHRPAAAVVAHELTRPRGLPADERSQRYGHRDSHLLARRATRAIDTKERLELPRHILVWKTDAVVRDANDAVPAARGRGQFDGPTP